MIVLRESGIEAIPVPLRSGRRAELQGSGWRCAESLRAASGMGARAAIIATETGRHVRDAEEALDLGMHVLVEKPMAPTAADALHLPQKAAAQERGLFVGCCLRFDPGLAFIRKRISEFGEIHSVRIECGSFLPEWQPGRDYRLGYSARADEGGVLRDLIHEVDYAIWLFGFPQWVFGTLSNLARIGVESEELADAIWVTGSGTSVSLSLDYLTRHPRRRLSISGSQGSFDYCLLSRKLITHIAGKDPHEMVFARRPNDLYLDQVSEFMSVIAGNPRDRIATGEDGLHALGVCDAWRKSSASGCRERPPTIL